MAGSSSPDQIGPVTSMLTDVLLTDRFIDLARYLVDRSVHDKEGKGINPRDLYARHYDFGYNRPQDMTPDLVTMMRMGPLSVSGKSYDDFAGYMGNNEFIFTGIMRYDRSK
jgi:hypothetical protein